MRLYTLILISILVIAALPLPAGAYSVLTHEEIIDLVWKQEIRTLLLERFPQATPDELRQAHAYAYGGCVIQDLGYYPFGNKEFSNLLHYVRSGDFVAALLRDSSDLNEYAFAVGALAHYAADISGHPSINHAVALTFPKLRAKYGESVTYEDNPKAHIRTEFGFDVTEVAKNQYAPDSYHDFIGFEVAKPLLERAFLETYGVPLDDMFFSTDLAIGTYRRAVSKAIPEFTRAALLTRRAQMVSATPNFNERKFLYRLKRADYQREWGKQYQRPGIGARVLAFLFKLVPKVGPFKAISFQMPTTQTENLFVGGVDQTVDHFRAYLRQAGEGSLTLPNRDFDTGAPTSFGEYRLTDESYGKLLDKVAGNNFSNVDAALQQNIIQFYAAAQPPPSKKERERWAKLQSELERLRNFRGESQPTAASRP